MSNVKITFAQNGPYLVTGPIDLETPDGQPIDIPAGRTTVALCRCGASVNKPFCDGTHSKIGFNAAKAAVPES
ncbi:MAG: CDGSH iron-sulfur domain-containing protein [Candidatus Velthaea sp.]